MGVLVELEASVAAAKAVAAGLEPGCLAGGDAVLLVEVAAEGERVFGAVKALAAARVAESGLWRQAGERSAAHWLARSAGGSVGAAAAVLDTAQRLDELPEVDRAYRAGELSETQARHIASAAAVRPGCQGELLAVARTDSVQGLGAACRKVTDAVGDDTARQAAVHRGRYCRWWTDPDGAGRLAARLTVADLAVVAAGLAAFEDVEFDTARAAGRREPYHAYTADALVAMAKAAAGGGPHGLQAKVIVNVDHAALIRGCVVAGETCEIAGVGPISVSVARAMTADAFLAALISDGVDVYTVAHLGRSVTAVQRTALEARDPECVVPGCHVHDHLEIDHVDPWSATKVTKLDRLARLCRFHHHQKTYDGYQLTGRPGHWQWLKPDSTPVDDP